MDLIDLAYEAGLEPRRTSSHGGGEYHTGCPQCHEGDDRFMIWPNAPSTNCAGRYWCRQCNAKGDTIKFCINFLGLSFQEACAKLDVTVTESPRRPILKSSIASLKLAVAPPTAWQEKAGSFVEWCHQELLENPKALKKLYNRGFTDTTISHFKLGYCPIDTWRSYSDWGLDTELKTDGKPRKIWLPYGLVVTWFDTHGNVLKINIRRLQWHKEDKYGKYIKIPGSVNSPAIYGDSSLPCGLILESEFDALLIQQEAGDMTFCIANGGSSQPLDLGTHRLIRKTPLILFCPDVDMAGAKFFQRLQKTYKHGVLWPAPIGKSPGDAFEQGIDLRQWILEAQM